MNSKNLIGSFSLLVATIALILPLILDYFAAPKLDFIVDKELRIQNKFSGLVLVPFLHINNSGNATGSISAIKLVLTKSEDDSSFKKTFTAQAYSNQEDPDSSGQMFSRPLVKISLLPDETWDAFIYFHKRFSLAEENKSKEMFEQINQERQKSMDERQSKKQPRFSEDLFNEMKSYMKERLKSFQIGTYKLNLKIFSKSSTELVAQQCHSFTVHEDHLEKLDKIIEQYRYIREDFSSHEIKFDLLELSNCE